MAVSQDTKSQTLSNQYQNSIGLSQTLESLIFDQKNSQYFIGTRRILFLDEGYIPQGIHIEDKHYYISMYHKTIKGESGTKGSIIVKYDIEGNFVKKLNLFMDKKEFTGHVGGVGLIGNSFVVPEGKELYFFNSENGEFIKKITLDFSELNEQIKTISFLNISKDHLGNSLLLVGEFREKGIISLENFIFAHQIVDKETVSLKPILQFSFPNSISQVQGASILAADEKKYTLLLSRSFGDFPSKLHKLTFLNEGKDHFKFKLSKSKEVLEAPAGMECLQVTENRVWSLSESGTAYFQRRTVAPWKTNFPFVFTLNKKLILNSN
jgi:hypothetical protein